MGTGLLYFVTQVSKLFTLKDVIPKMEKPGVYEIRCSCGDRYDGQSGRTFFKRFLEHRRVFYKLSNSIPIDSTSALAQHCHVLLIAFELSALDHCTNGRKVDRLEEYYTLLAIQQSLRPGHNRLGT